MSVNCSRSPPSSSSLPSTPDAEAADTALLNTQLLSELAQAAASTMVPIPVNDFAFTNQYAAVSIASPHSSRPSKIRKLGNGEDTLNIQNRTQRQESFPKLRNTQIQRRSPTPVKGLGRSSFVGKLSQDAIEAISIPQRDQKMASPKHMRFGSEEAGLEPPFESNPSEASSRGDGLEYEDAKEDDDEAPEAITAAVGFEASRTAALDAARTARRQKSALRAQRREKDARLKTQAQAAKSQKRQKPSSPIMIDTYSLDNDIESLTSTRQNDSKNPSKVSLPALLPDELLAEEPVIQPSHLLLPMSTQIMSKKTRLSEKKQKAPKDIKRGNKMVRVLQAQEGILPPTSSSTSKSVREKWLLGERGFLGAASVPRRKSAGGFARR